MFLFTTLLLYLLGGYLIAKSNAQVLKGLQLDDKTKFLLIATWPISVIHMVILDVMGIE